MVLPAYTPQTKKELFGVHARLSGAPDRIYQVSNARPDEYCTLESLVAELHRGVDRVFRKERHEEARAHLHAAIDATYNEFKMGREHEGRTRWHELGELIHQTRP